MAGPSTNSAWTISKAARPALPLLIVEARYYADVGQALRDGALAELEAQGVGHDTVEVPGALEIPQALAAACQAGVMAPTAGARYSGAVLLGCVIRGETSHYDIVCNNANHWSYEIGMRHPFPVGNAILTVDTLAQAMARARGSTPDGRSGKGADAVRACLKLIEIAAGFRAGPMR
jgi:6,7-dimethyl-8-ribityllumazine synthase